MDATFAVFHISLFMILIYDNDNNFFNPFKQLLISK